MTDQIFLDRINSHPILRNRVEALLNVVENTNGDCTKASAAEQYVIDEIRKMGNDALHCWANNEVLNSTKRLLKEESGIHGNGKKKSIGIPPLER